MEDLGGQAGNLVHVQNPVNEIFLSINKKGLVGKEFHKCEITASKRL